MDISRRRLLQLGILQAGLIALPVRSEPILMDVRRRSSPSILQGATDESATQFSIVHSIKDKFDFEIYDSRGQLYIPHKITEHTQPNQPAMITRVFATGLSLGETYHLVLKDRDTSNLVDQREFKTLDLAKEDLSFAICSCMDDGRHSADIWQDLVANSPDVILFAGDSAYCDYGRGDDSGFARIWRRHCEARATLEIYFSKKLIPILATWDDHDFGKNDVGRDFPHAAQSRESFLTFFAQDPTYCRGLERGPGISTRFVIGTQQIILMDDRTYRIVGRSEDRFAHWGEEQENWMVQKVREHAGMSWILNGSQMVPHMLFKESMSGQHEVQFKGFMTALRSTGRKVAFISGDVHFSEISEVEADLLGFKTYELTSSSIHSQKVPGAPSIFPNERRIKSTGERNYLLVNSQSFADGAHFQVASRSPKNRVNFQIELTV